MSTRTVGIIVVTILLAGGIGIFLANSGSTTVAEAEAAKIKWYSYDEGIAAARRDNKKLLVDVYTDWCVWCKKMDKEVYTDKRVGDAIVADFVAVKLNAESQRGVTVDGSPMSESALAGAMGVTGYPTIVFLDASAKPITKISGYMEPREFASALRFIGEDHYKNQTFKAYKNSTTN